MNSLYCKRHFNRSVDIIGVGDHQDVSFYEARPNARKHELIVYVIIASVWQYESFFPFVYNDTRWIQIQMAALSLVA